MHPSYELLEKETYLLGTFDSLLSVLTRVQLIGSETEVDLVAYQTSATVPLGSFPQFGLASSSYKGATAWSQCNGTKQF